ncbi:probable transmembrane reductase CYB561D1 isoform X1 [Girardinichthys multiradiatus]|uniref:probable transmembrane reductase CYB561D1 isoform X1 n=2 Tax=Girardinichthys multiradiatus TaxID=208333 RepID=UPI001FADAA33|nr:probable transmembrane reductase CYB561D1 isoform X1 [Girardinichthys multiradiatus]
MPFDVEYSPVGDGLGMRDFWLYVWLRRAALIAAHVVGLGLTLIISVLSRPGTSLFSWHPLCMSVAYCLCMTEGILLFSAEGTIFCFKSRKNKVRFHWLCQALVLIAAAVGLGFILASKTVSELPHLVSWHSLLGFSTLTASLLQAACGICVIFHKQLRLSPSPARLKLYHATCGLVVYLLATVTVILAMFSDWFQATVKGIGWWVFAMLPLSPATVVMNQITNAYLLRNKMTS